ncbi:MAG: DUF962 domain-containing protein [Terriglobales bacterium]
METLRSKFLLEDETQHTKYEDSIRQFLSGRSRDMILRVLGGRSDEQWIAQYGSSHRHPMNRFCHTLGIPTILLSGAVFIASIFYHRLWLYALALFLVGWIFQFIGHAFEGKPPEFFSDWRFLFVGVRWWWAKIHGKA